MRLFVFASILSLCLAGTAQAAPRRVASLNLCSDELLLMLGRPSQIASVTHLSQDRDESPLWRSAGRYHRNDGSLASVAALRPDLILSFGGGIRDRAGIARRLGAGMIDLPFPQTLDDIEVLMGRVARALGRTREAEPLIARLRHLRATRPVARLDAIWMGGGGNSLSATGLGAEWMALAGLRQRLLKGDRITLEKMLLRPPAILLRSNYRSRQTSRGQQWTGHPLARRVRGGRPIDTDGRRWTCMGPTLIAEVERLRRVQR